MFLECLKSKEKYRKCKVYIHPGIYNNAHVVNVLNEFLQNTVDTWKFLIFSIFNEYWNTYTVHDLKHSCSQSMISCI